MRNNIFLKALAILLCAASLMGIVGGAAGALVLVEGDLYNRTVDQMLDEKLQLDASVFAEQKALAYASQQLGGCPEEIIRRYGVRPDCDYGYAIVDPEGNVLESLNPEMKDTAEVYSVPVKGQYMHLVSTETESQLRAKEAETRLAAHREGLTSSSGEAVPAEGVSINQVWFLDFNGNHIYEAYGDRDQCTSTYFYANGYTTNSSSYEHEPLNRVGFLFHGPDGQLIYHSFLEENEYDFPATEVYGVMFMSHDRDLYFQTEDPNGIGILVCDGGELRFTSYLPAEEAAAETVPETTPVSVPETVSAETFPEEAATAVTEIIAETEEPHPEAETEVTEETAENEEETASEDEEASSASADPDEEPWFLGDEDIDWEYFDKKAWERIFYDWLLAGELIDKEDAPDDLIPNVDLHYWLTEYNIIDSDQVIPVIGIIPEEPEPEETEPEVTEPEETAPAETIPEETVVEETVPEETLPVVTEPILINGKPLETYQINRTEYTDSATGEYTTAKYVYLPLPELTVEVYLNRNTLDYAEFYNVLEMVRQYRSVLLPVIGICLLLFGMSAVYLYAVAGRNSATVEIRAGGLNRLPLDLYLIGGFCLGLALAALAVAGVPWLLNSDFLLGCSFAVAIAFVCCLIFVGFFLALAAQVKTGGGYWWRNTLSVRFVFLSMRVLQWLERWFRETGFPWLFRFCRKVWNVIWKWLVRLYEAVEKITASTGAKLNRFFSLIPMTWQWLLAGLTIILFALLVNTHHILLILIGILVPMAIILYATHCFGLLSESAKRMGKGNLDTKVQDKLMIGCFRDFANDLNDLADVATVAAQKQLKSERMKTELITNVSHDIKTPLTSIINYVDLLQKPHTEEESGQYLEVLDRQSQRLKKLVDDLMDMSKASTGNMAVEITRVDAVESVNQALGEFADKLERAQLYPVFRHSEDSVPIMADGKLVWRVLSNLLSNAVKYAMPGTRIYLDLSRMNGKVIISLKNISRKELNIDAEELMERFVRGDVSRNTEGSGLGLNIAKSLMELQKGQLQLLVDGDLFKVTLVFPDAQ